MSQKFTNNELNKCSKTELVNIFLSLQDQIDKLNENFENLIEQLGLPISISSDVSLRSWMDSYLFSTNVSICQMMLFKNRPWKVSFRLKIRIKSKKENAMLI